MHGIHFPKGGQSQLLEIGVGPVLETRRSGSPCDPVFLVKSLSGHADTGAGLLKALPVFAVSKPGIVSVFVSNGAMGAISLKEVPLESSFWM